MSDEVIFAPLFLRCTAYLVFSIHIFAMLKFTFHRNHYSYAIQLIRSAGQALDPMCKVGACLPMVGSLQYRTLSNCMYWFPLPIKIPVMIRPIQC